MTLLKNMSHESQVDFDISNDSIYMESPKGRLCYQLSDKLTSESKGKQTKNKFCCLPCPLYRLPQKV